MDVSKLQQAIDEISGYVRRNVATGFRGAEEIMANLLDLMADEYDVEELRPHAERLLRDAVRAHREAQRRWPARTDCDRLDSAFARLEQSGIVCRHDFSCCGNCGSAEIWDEIAQERERGREVTGYAFYHMQDMDSAVEGHGLYLNYGSVLQGQKAAVLVGNEIAAALRAEGLSVDWDGTWPACVHVKLDWKRRLPPEQATG